MERYPLPAFWGGITVNKNFYCFLFNSSIILPRSLFTGFAYTGIGIGVLFSTIGVDEELLKFENNPLNLPPSAQSKSLGIFSNTGECSKLIRFLDEPEICKFKLEDGLEGKDTVLLVG
jgi:hypothetical protein